MSKTRKPAEQILLETGTLVRFRVVDTHTELSPDKENVFVRANLVFEGNDQDTEPAEIVEWSALRWLDTLRGKKPMTVVSSASESEIR